MPAASWRQRPIASVVARRRSPRRKPGAPAVPSAAGHCRAPRSATRIVRDERDAGENHSATGFRNGGRFDRPDELCQHHLWDRLMADELEPAEQSSGESLAVLVLSDRCWSFRASPDTLWEQMTAVDRYRVWWPWLRRSRHKRSRAPRPGPVRCNLPFRTCCGSRSCWTRSCRSRGHRHDRRRHHRGMRRAARGRRAMRCPPGVLTRPPQPCAEGGREGGWPDGSLRARLGAQHGARQFASRLPDG